MAIGGLLLVSESIQTMFDGSTLGAGYKIYTYEAGTSTPLSTYPTYDDAVAQTNANANPTIADSSGRVAIWGSGTTAYKIVFKDADDTTIKTIDDVYLVANTGVGVFAKGTSEYQFTCWENVSGSSRLTDAQTEGTYDFKYGAGGITLSGGKTFTHGDFVWTEATSSLKLTLAACPHFFEIENSGNEALLTIRNTGTAYGQIECFADAASGDTPSLQITGYFSGGTQDTLNINVGAVADQAATFSGCAGGYIFDNSLKIGEIASAVADTTNYGQLWVRSSDNALMYTNESGTDYTVDVTAV